MGSSEMVSPEMVSPEMGSSGMTSPEMISPGMGRPAGPNQRLDGEMGMPDIFDDDGMDSQFAGDTIGRPRMGRPEGPDLGVLRPGGPSRGPAKKPGRNQKQEKSDVDKFLDDMKNEHNASMDKPGFLLGNPSPIAHPNQGQKGQRLPYDQSPHSPSEIQGMRRKPHGPQYPQNSQINTGFLGDYSDYQLMRDDDLFDLESGRTQGMHSRHGMGHAQQVPLSRNPLKNVIAGNPMNTPTNLGHGHYNPAESSSSSSNSSSSSSRRGFRGSSQGW